MRKRWSVPGTLFSAYLMLNGMERFWIEKIRVNAPMEFMGMVMTQAELIAVVIFLSGLVMMAFIHQKTWRKWMGR